MAKRIQFRRAIWLVVLLGIGFSGLGYRLVELQVLRHDALSVRAQQNTQQEVFLEPRRGDILDIKGNVLATSVFVKTVCADPVLVGNRQAEVAHAVAPILGLDEAGLTQRLMPQLRRNDKGETLTNRYVVLKRKVPMETWMQVRAAMTNLSFGLDEKKLRRSESAFYRDLRQKAIFTDPVDDQMREYPNASLAAHVLGYVGMATNADHSLTTSGKDGIELTMNSKLAGVRGWRLTETDRQKRELVPWREQEVEPRDGLNVVLTLDSVIQLYLEKALAEALEKHSPLDVSAMVIRPRTGEILAMATLPSYTPCNPGQDETARRNRIITDIVEPGSTFKIVVVSGALNDGTVRLSDMFNCEHRAFRFAGRVLHDHESYGALSVQDIIMKSSNIGAAKVGIKMGEDRLSSYIRDFGFGTRTGIPLKGEQPGIVHPVTNWSKVSIAQIPMGQGVAVTRLQMTMAMCAIANKGWLMRPMLVDRLEDRDHKVLAQYSPQRVRQVISENAAKTMITALKTVVSPEGTAPKAALEHYTVAGKTGTAQKSAGKAGYSHDKYFASFIGFFPADNPEVCISVMMDEPKTKQGYYGGQVCAPVFKTIAESVANYLNIKPEDSEANPDGLASPGETAPVKTAGLVRP